MQSMMYDVRTLYRWKRVEADQEYGDCVADYKRTRPYDLSFRPTPTSIESTEQGTVHRTGHRIYTNGHDFQEGDRIGGWDRPTMEVVSVTDHTTGQIIEASDL